MVEFFGNLLFDVLDFFKEFFNLISGMGKYKGELVCIYVDEFVKFVV